MEKLYRLKEEVKPYFDADYHERKMELGSWKCAGITISALDEVKLAVVTVGFKKDERSNSISHWAAKSGGSIYFTVNIPVIGMNEFDKFTDKRTEIAEKFEEVVNEMLNNK